MSHINANASLPKTAYKPGDVVRLLSYEDLPARHKRSGYFRKIQDNEFKMAFLETEMTIARIEFSRVLEEWKFHMKEDHDDWVWMEDMFAYNRPPDKEKAQRDPRMPLI